MLYCKNSIFNILSNNVWDNYTKIRIYNSAFGRLQIEQANPNHFVKYARLELFSSEINVKSSSIGAIWERYHKAVFQLQLQYGITISLEPTVHLIEFCFTFAADAIIPLPVRKYIVAAFAESTCVNAKHYTATSTKDDQHLIVSKSHDCQKEVFYDKTAKAEHLNQIDKSKNSKHKIRVYRLEFTIEKSKLKKDKDLRSALFSNTPKGKNLRGISLSCFTDNNIIDYLRIRVFKAIDYYRNKMIPKSLQTVTEYLKASRSTNPIQYIRIFDDKIAKYQAEYDYSFIIDDESIIFSDLAKVFDKSNVARSRKALVLSAIESSESPRKQLFGWEVERVFALMLQCLKYPLGVEYADKSNSLKYFTVARGKYREKENYLKKLISHRKRNKQINYSELILSRIETDWIKDDFEPQSLLSLNKYTKTNEK